MKYLLVGINAKYIHSNLAIHCLRAYAKKYSDITPEVAEFTINMPVSDIIRGIYEKAPDFIALSAYIWNIDIVMQVAKDIHTLLPEAIIYLGGPEVSYESVSVMQNNPEITGIMLGEGEQTFLELINHYEYYTSSSQSAICLEDTDSTPSTYPHGALPLRDINGLCFRDLCTGEIITTPARNPIDLSSLPFPYEKLTDFENKIIYYETSRGCPFGCSYCLSSVDKTVRFRSMDLVKKEFLFFLNAEVPQVKLVDRTFNIDHKRSIEMLEFLRDNDNGITNFHFEIAGDILTDEEIELICSLRPGLIQLEIGVQSTNSDTLASINRHTDLDKLRTNVARLLAADNVHLHLDLIAGLPYENLDSFKNSFNAVYSMHSHELQLGFLKVLKGAPINSMVEKQKIKYSGHAPYEVLSTEFLSYEDICELKLVEELLELYHNSCQFTYAEEYLLKLEPSPYDMYLGLANHYIQNGQLITQCKRATRYEILLDYAVQKFSLDDYEISHLRNLLTIDYYSREKAKARPAFAPELSSDQKSRIRTIMEELTSASPSAMYHVEPIWGNTKYAVFDYARKSIITSNAHITYVE